MEHIGIALERDKSHIIRKARLKISEWLDFKNRGSNIIVTIYLEFSDPKKSHKLNHIYMIIPENDFKNIALPTEEEIKEENKILNREKVSRKLNIKSRFIPGIPVKNIRKIPKKNQEKEHILIKIELDKFEVDDTKTNRLQFRLYKKDSIRKKSILYYFSEFPWDWIYESPIHPVIIEKNEFANLTQIKFDLELWVMIEPSMYNSVSDLNLRSTRPFDRFIILPKDISNGLGRKFVKPKTLCIRWFFREFSESGLGVKFIVSKKNSTMEREKRYIDKINSDEKYFFSYINKILNDSRIVCLDFNYIADKLRREEFSQFLRILFELTYYRNNKALSKLGDLVEILEELQELEYGSYYFHMHRLLNKMQSCESVKEILSPKIKKWLNEFVNESAYINKAIMDLFEELIDLIVIIEQFYYYNIPKDKYLQKRDILKDIAKLKNTAEQKLVNPESYILAEEILLNWERLVENEFKQFVGAPKVKVELKTKKLFHSERIHLIFDIINTSDVPLVNLVARLLHSEQYKIIEREKRGTTKRKRLTKSDEHNKRIFSPEFVISPKNFPYVKINLEIEALTEKEELFSEIFERKIELVHEKMEFKEIEENPYIVGKPVKIKKMFFGRRNVLKKIRSTIVGIQVNQAIIHGQFRTGKTSVLYRLMDELKGRYIPVLAITHEFETGDSELLRFWSMQICSAVKNRLEKVPEAPDYNMSSNSYKEFQRFVDKIMEKLGEVRIIFMVDEYDLIDEFLQNRELGDELFHLFDWIIKHDKIELIMAGRSPMETLTVEKWKDIARSFAHIKLGPLDKKNAKRLIEEPISSYLKYDDSALERIVRLTNCYPYLVQLCCHVLVNHHNSKIKNLLNYADVEYCIPEMIELGKYGLETMILTNTTSEEQIVLQVMASVLKEQTSIREQELVVRIREYKPSLEDRHIKNAISCLEKKDIIRSTTEETRSFMFVCEIYRYWIDAKLEPLISREIS